ncbi:MAG: SET domain-containing protein [Rhodospirillales bacterium]|nr:SET domain-containing protein [Rhodospirillales bacterium]
MSWTNSTMIEVRSVSGECGVFALTDLEQGSVVGVFDGVAEVFTVDEQGNVDWRDQNGAWSIHLKLTEDKLYTIMPPPGVHIEGIDFINHSCEANCRCDAGVLVVETTRPIRKDEQLTLNYHDMDLVKLGRPCWCDHKAPEERCIL